MVMLARGMWYVATLEYTRAIFEHNTYRTWSVSQLTTALSWVSWTLGLRDTPNSLYQPHQLCTTQRCYYGTIK